MKARFFSAVLAAMMLACASIGITASAEEAEQATADVAETTAAADNSEDESSESETEDTAESAEVATETSSVSEDTEDMEKLREVMSELAEAGTTDVQPDYYGDPYYDTDGNATLIKSESIIYNTEEMQFIAVTTKDGHVFYVLINYSAADGQDNVYFLNRVDDYDLYALLYAGSEDDDEKNNITPEQALQAAEAANGRVKHDNSGVPDTAETDESGEDTTEEVASRQNNMNMNSVYLVFGAVALIGVGAAGFFVMKKKNGGGNSKSAMQDEPEYDDDNEITEDEDDMKFYDDQDDEI